MTDLNCICDMSCQLVILKNGIFVYEPIQETLMEKHGFKLEHSGPSV